MNRVLLAETETQWTVWGAEELVSAAVAAFRARGEFHFVLPGGSSPRAILGYVAERYARGTWWADAASQEEPVALERVWSSTRVYFGDERAVGPEHPDSNFRMVREAWLDRVPVPATQIHRMRGEGELESAARDYRDQVAQLLEREGGAFDLVALGLGPDGHTASLVPGRALDYVAPPWVGVGPAPLSPAKVRRITLTAAALRRTRRCVFWIKGAEKAEVVRAALTGRGAATLVPEVIPESGPVTWLLDAGAASRLRP